MQNPCFLLIEYVFNFNYKIVIILPTYYLLEFGEANHSIKWKNFRYNKIKLFKIFLYLNNKKIFFSYIWE